MSGPAKTSGPEEGAAHPPLALQAWADGACLGNPGPGGWGVVLALPGESAPRERSGGEGRSTNNRMELEAAIQALALAKEAAGPAPLALELRSDSEYLCKGFTEWLPAWKRRGWRTASRKPVENQDLWLRLEEAAAGTALSLIWVRGHAGEPGNERADALAYAAAKKAAAAT